MANPKKKTIDKSKPAAVAKEPWYSEGLKFQCTGCGDCCTGEPGYVWLNKQEIAEMAALVEQDVETFEDAYVREVGIRKSLREHENGDCYFLDTKTRKCQVYAARPRQCRTWPFWDSNLKSPKAWAEACEVCPGSGEGKLYSLEHINTERAVVKV